MARYRICVTEIIVSRTFIEAESEEQALAEAEAQAIEGNLKVYDVSVAREVESEGVA